MLVTAQAPDPPTTALRWSPHESSQVAHTHQRDSATPGPFRGAAGELSAAFAGLDVIAAGEGQGEAWLLARARRAAAEH